MGRVLSAGRAKQPEKQPRGEGGRHEKNQAIRERPTSDQALVLRRAKLRIDFLPREDPATRPVAAENRESLSRCASADSRSQERFAGGELAEQRRHGRSKLSQARQIAGRQVTVARICDWAAEEVDQ